MCGARAGHTAFLKVIRRLLARAAGGAEAALYAPPDLVPKQPVDPPRFGLLLAALHTCLLTQPPPALLHPLLQRYRVSACWGEPGSPQRFLLSCTGVRTSGGGGDGEAAAYLSSHNVAL